MSDGNLYGTAGTSFFGRQLCRDAHRKPMTCENSLYARMRLLLCKLCQLCRAIKPAGQSVGVGTVSSRPTVPTVPYR